MEAILDQKTIVKCVVNADNPKDAISNLYRAVFPMFDDIEKFHGYPRVNPVTSKFIQQAGYGKFENEFLVEWINKGFNGGADYLKDWEVDTSKVTIVWKTNMIPDRMDRSFPLETIGTRFQD